jgi:hypothetical protein
MAFVIAAPEFVVAAAADLANIGSTINSASAERTDRRKFARQALDTPPPNSAD